MRGRRRQAPAVEIPHRKDLRRVRIDELRIRAGGECFRLTEPLARALWTAPEDRVLEHVGDAWLDARELLVDALQQSVLHGRVRAGVGGCETDDEQGCQGEQELEAQRHLWS